MTHSRSNAFKHTCMQFINIGHATYTEHTDMQIMQTCTPYAHTDHTHTDHSDHADHACVVHTYIHIHNSQDTYIK